jgi:predicted nuclease of predicted toxin-antitoxin system
VRLLIDNNLSHKLASVFKNSVHVRDNVGVGASDAQIWEYAKSNDFIILTKDNDFDELSQINGCPPKVIHLHIGNKSTALISNLLSAYQKEIKLFADADNSNCLMKLLAV